MKGDIWFRVFFSSSGKYVTFIGVFLISLVSSLKEVGVIGLPNGFLEGFKQGSNGRSNEGHKSCGKIECLYSATIYSLVFSSLLIFSL